MILIVWYNKKKCIRIKSFVSFCKATIQWILFLLHDISIEIVVSLMSHIILFNHSHARNKLSKLNVSPCPDFQNMLWSKNRISPLLISTTKFYFFTYRKKTKCSTKSISVHVFISIKHGPASIIDGKISSFAQAIVKIFNFYFLCVTYGLPCRIRFWFFMWFPKKMSKKRDRWRHFVDLFTIRHFPTGPFPFLFACLCVCHQTFRIFFASFMANNAIKNKYWKFLL